jgi:pimeloyl-[acyl-carrier protein] methyl ester esterase
VTRPNLILLPGLDGTGILFRPLLAALPEDISPKVIAYPADRRLSLAEHADFVASHLATDAVVLAESFSGLVALDLLTRRSLPIKRVLFVGCFAEAPHPLARFATRLPWAGSVIRAAPEFALRRYCLGEEATAEQLALLREALAAVSPRVLAHRLGLIGARQTFAEGKFKVPCCYLQASQDRLVSRAAAGWFQRHFVSCLVDILDGSHFLIQTRPQACAEWIAAKVRSV